MRLLPVDGVTGVDAVGRVTYGGKWLDNRYPNWINSVPVVAAKIRINSLDHCVLARVARVKSFLLLIPNIIKADEALRCGFTGGYGVTSDQLRDAWLNEVRRRLREEEEQRVRGLLESLGITSTRF